MTARRGAEDAKTDNTKEVTMSARFPRPMRRCTALAVAGVAIGGACGGGGGGQGGSVPTPDNREVSSTVEVTAVDIDFSGNEFTAQAGTVRFVYRNDGQINHTLVIEGVPAFDTLEVNRKGDTDEGTVELEPGTYTIFCDVPGHRRAGMEAKLLVR